jgi:hypothetical protein
MASDPRGPDRLIRSPRKAIDDHNDAASDQHLDKDTPRSHRLAEQIGAPNDRESKHVFYSRHGKDAVGPFPNLRPSGAVAGPGHLALTKMDQSSMRPRPKMGNCRHPSTSSFDFASPYSPPPFALSRSPSVSRISPSVRRRRLTRCVRVC